VFPASGGIVRAKEDRGVFPPLGCRNRRILRIPGHRSHRREVNMNLNRGPRMLAATVVVAAAAFGMAGAALAAPPEVAVLVAHGHELNDAAHANTAALGDNARATGSAALANGAALNDAGRANSATLGDNAQALGAAVRANAAGLLPIVAS
jgi:hypothetical protein